MPEEFRTSRGCVHPWRRGILAAIGVVAAAPVRAEEAPALALREVVVSASRSLDRHEIVTLVFILGLLFFAVVTAIMLLRARVRAARQEAAAHETIAALRARRNTLPIRVTAFQSEVMSHAKNPTPEVGPRLILPQVLEQR